MKKLLIYLFFCLLPFGLLSQEIREGNRSIPSAQRPQESTKEIAAELFPLTIEREVSGPFALNRYTVPLYLMDIHPEQGRNQKIDILAISKAKEEHRKARIRSVNTARQIAQIISQSRVFLEQDQENGGLHSLDYGRRAPDGGIRNEALKEIPQPFIRPYDNYYQPGYYNPYYNRPSNLYFYRR